MTKKFHDLYVALSAEDGDPAELDELARELKMEIDGLNVESDDKVSAGFIPEGTKAADWASIGQLIVILAPAVIPPMFDLLKTWVDRKPQLRLKSGLKLEGKQLKLSMTRQKQPPKTWMLLSSLWEKP